MSAGKEGREDGGVRTAWRSFTVHAKWEGWGGGWDKYPVTHTRSVPS